MSDELKEASNALIKAAEALENIDIESIVESVVDNQLDIDKITDEVVEKIDLDDKADKRDLDDKADADELSRLEDRVSDLEDEVEKKVEATMELITKKIEEIKGNLVRETADMIISSVMKQITEMLQKAISPVAPAPVPEAPKETTPNTNQTYIT